MNNREPYKEGDLDKFFGCAPDIEEPNGVEIGRDGAGEICHYVQVDGWVSVRMDCKHYERKDLIEDLVGGVEP